MDDRDQMPPTTPSRRTPAWQAAALEHPELLKSLAIGLEIRTCFEATQQTLDLTQLTEMVGVRKRSKLRRHISVLLADGYLEQTGAESYRLSARAGDAGLAIVETLALRLRARAALQRLRARTGYTASLLALDGLEVVYLSRLASSQRGQHEVDEGIGIGARAAAHRTAAGIVLLSHLRPQQRRERLAKIVPTQGAAESRLSSSALHRTLMESRRRGFAVSEDGDRRSIAAPVMDENRRVVAAIQIDVPASRVSREALLESFRPVLVHEASSITARAGDFPA